MKLREILTEKITDDPIKLADILHRDCEMFLNETKPQRSEGSKSGYLPVFYRGHKIKNDSILKRRPRKENRRPKDTPQELHDMLNEMFVKKFGWPVRNGVFATTNYEQDKEYGDVSVFMPIGEYKYAWSPKVTDLYMDLNDTFIGEYTIPDFYSEDMKSEWQVDMMDYLDYVLSAGGIGVTAVDSKGNKVNIQRLLAGDEEDDEEVNALVEYDGKVKRFFAYLTRGNKKLGKYYILKAPKLQSFEEWREEMGAEKFEKKVQSFVDSYRSDGLGITLSKAKEVSFWCDEYYLINTGLMRKIKL